MQYISDFDYRDYDEYYDDDYEGLLNEKHIYILLSFFKEKTNYIIEYFSDDEIYLKNGDVIKVDTFQDLDDGNYVTCIKINNGLYYDFDDFIESYDKMILRKMQIDEILKT